MRFARLGIFVSMTLIAVSGCFVAFPAAEGKFERTLNVTGPVDLDVSTGSGRIEVRAGSSSVVRVYALIKARDDWHGNAEEKVRFLENNPPIEQNGNVIRIGRIEDENYRNNVSISYEIETPAETRLIGRTGSGSQKIDGLRGPVDATTGSGSVSMWHVTGDVNARTGSGSIELDSISGSVNAATGSGSIRGLRVGGSVKAMTGSGGITLEPGAAERGAILDVEATTGSGSIDVSGINGALRANTGSGGITAAGNPLSEWKIQTASGGAHLRLPSDAAFDLYARTGSGRISVAHPVTVTGTMGRNEMRGKVRGGGSLVEVRTSSGGITIE